MLKSDTYFTFTVAIVTKRLKIERLSFLTKFEAFGDRCFKN